MAYVQQLQASIASPSIYRPIVIAARGSLKVKIQITPK